MDFVVNFFRSQKDFDSIWIVDRLAKTAQFIPTTTTVTTLGVAQLFVEQIFVNYGLPQEIIYDKHRKFMSEFQKPLSKLCGTKFSMSFVHHSETNGQSKRTNRILDKMLIMYVGNRQQF